MEPLSDIAVFVQVVDSGSFTDAAERLQLSKSVVSKYVTRLEEHLGARLLNRTTRRLSLTEVGQVFYEQSRRGLEQIEDATAEVSRLQGAPRGTLRINVPMSFGILHVAPAMADFQARYSDLSVDMNLDDRKLDLVEEGYDLAVRITNMSDSSLVARRIAPCRHVICAAPAYVERHGAPATPAELREHNVVSYKYQASVTQWEFASRTAEPLTVAVSGSTRMNNSLAIREALLCGIGIARTPTFVVGEDIRKGLLVPLLTDYRMPELYIYVVYPHRHNLSPKVRAFVEFMAARIGDPPYWDSADAPAPKPQRAAAGRGGAR